MQKPLEIQVRHDVVHSSEKIIDLIARLKQAIGERSEATIDLRIGPDGEDLLALQWYSVQVYQAENRDPIKGQPIDILLQLLNNEGYEAKHYYESQQPNIIRLELRRKTVPSPVSPY